MKIVHLSPLEVLPHIKREINEAGEEVEVIFHFPLFVFIKNNNFFLLQGMQSNEI